MVVGALAFWAACRSVGTPRCDVETAYHCARVVDASPPVGAHTLHLDTLTHSYVNPDDPTDLRFSYIRAMAAVSRGGRTPRRAPTAPAHRRRRRDDAALHRGDPPRHDEHRARGRPRRREPGRQRLGLRTDDHLRVRVVDGRVGLHQTPTDTDDLVIGDAFGGRQRAVAPDDREAARDVQRVLRPGGIYAVNVIDYPPNAFAHAEFATLARPSPTSRHVRAGAARATGPAATSCSSRATRPCRSRRSAPASATIRRVGSC